MELSRMAASGIISMANLTILDANLELQVKPEWGVGNHLLLAGFHGSAHPRSPLKGPTLLHEVTWNTSLSNVHARKLVSESNGLFLTLQKLMSTEAENQRARQQQLVKISRKYRSVIKACVDQMQLMVDTSTDNVDDIIGEANQSTLEEQSQVFFKIELIWNLVEIMFIDLQPAGALLVSLLDWVRWHFPECEALVRDVMEMGEPSNHPSYWNAVYGYLLQGRIIEVRKLLRINCESESEEFVAMNELLRKMPIFSNFGTSSTSEYEMHWHQWHECCNLMLERGVFQLSPPLEKMCKLMCGDLSTFLEMTDICETWYFMMVSRLLYTNPCVKVTDLSELAHDYIDIFGGLSSVGDVDRILLSALEFNVLDVVRESSQSLDSWWFVAHITDLLHHVGHLDIDRGQGEVSLREFLLMEYASGLASDDSMWHFAIDYFDQCPTVGKQMIEAFLERTCIQSEWKANKMLHIALQRDMMDLARTICKLAGRRALTNGRLGSALSWAVKAKDSKFATYLAEHFISEYVRHGRFYASHLLDNLGLSVLVSNKLAFLGKYREFHRCFAENQLQQAANVLVFLLSSRLAPKTLWLSLLLDAIPLLESKEAILFDKEQTYELLYCLEELREADNDDGKTKVIRFALARNLARTFAELDIGD